MSPSSHSFSLRVPQHAHRHPAPHEQRSRQHQDLHVVPLHSATALVAALERLRADLIDRAFTLEQRGHVDAADVAITAAAHLEELCEEFSSLREEDTHLTSVDR